MKKILFLNVMLIVGFSSFADKKCPDPTFKCPPPDTPITGGPIGVFKPVPDSTSLDNNIKSDLILIVGKHKSLKILTEDSLIQKLKNEAKKANLPHPMLYKVDKSFFQSDIEEQESLTYYYYMIGEEK